MARSPRQKKTTPPRRRGPSVVGVNLAVSSYEYLQRLHDLGLFEGPAGRENLHKDLRPLIEAFHHVLTGGKIEVRVARSGNATLLKELNDHLGRSIRETNQINQLARHPLVAQF
jgi:hypothetical protein